MSRHILLLCILWYQSLDVLHAYTLVNRLPLGAGTFDIESVEYDAATQQYLIASWYTSSIYPFPASIVESATYDTNDTSFIGPGPVADFPVNTWRDAGNADSPYNNAGESATFAETFSTWRPAGMQTVGNSLFVVDFYVGRVAQWDTSTQAYVDSILVDYAEGSAANLDGLCVDPSATNMLYATDFGYNVDAAGAFVPTGQQAVYAINTDTGAYERIYDSTVAVDGATDGYSIFPNGCVVVDGVLYTVDFNYDTAHNFGFSQYDIGTGEWSVTYDILPATGGDGLVYVDAIATFFTTDLVVGTLLKYEPGVDDAFEVIVTGITSPADMTYNADDKILAIAELDTGFVSFVQIDEALFSTTSFYYTTTDASDDLLTTPPPKDIDTGDEGVMSVPLGCMFIMSLLSVYFV